MQTYRTRALSLGMTLALAAAATSRGDNLILNGTFESGNLTGWSPITIPSGNTTGSCNQGFTVQSTAAGCLTGVNPNSGTYALYSSTSFPNIANDTGSYINALFQDFVAPSSVGSAIFSWSQSAALTGGGGGIVQVALLSGPNTLFNKEFVVANQITNGQQQWTNYSFDVTSILQANPNATFNLMLWDEGYFNTQNGQTLAATSLNVGFDNVALNVSGPVPEPSTVGLMAMALAVLGLSRLHVGGRQGRQ